MKLIWGFPGAVDGYGNETTECYKRNDYLALIGKTLDDYTDIPEERPSQVGHLSVL